jgi:hypothetical protein
MRGDLRAYRGLDVAGMTFSLSTDPMPLRGCGWNSANLLEIGSNCRAFARHTFRVGLKPTSHKEKPDAICFADL